MSAAIAPVEAAAGAGVPRKRRSFRFSRRDWLGFLGLALVVLAVLAGSVGTFVLPHDPFQSQLGLRLKPPAWLPGSDPRYWLGTDQLGRDLLARVALGARVSLLVGVAATAVATVLGVTLGLLAGYYRGWLDAVLGAVMDVQLSFPLLALAIAIVAVLGAGLGTLIVVLGITGWTSFARIVRAEVLI